MHGVGNLNSNGLRLLNTCAEFDLLVTNIYPLPSLHEVTQAVKGLKNNKASGPDGIPAEMFKYGGQYLLHRLHRFILLTWNSKQLPQQFCEYCHDLQAQRGPGSLR